jgi:beta-phosphoglucomutase-like phosphatase (HAD superfamily)
MMQASAAVWLDEQLIDSAIANGVKLAVCSSNTQKNVDLIVNSMGMVRSSNIEVYAGGRVSNRKPSPDIYNLAKGSVANASANARVNGNIVVEH